MKRLSPGKLLAQTVAAVAIALFWCISAVGTTVATTVGVTTLATAVNAVTATPAEARRRHRGRGRGRGRRRRGRHRRGRGICVGIEGLGLRLACEGSQHRLVLPPPSIPFTLPQLPGTPSSLPADGRARCCCCLSVCAWRSSGAGPFFGQP